jgi:hypothetical protein
MRNKKVLALALGAAMALAITPSMVGAAPKAPKSGTWTFIDTTPDPSTAADSRPRCTQGDLPSSPADVNVQTIKLTKKRQTFSVMGNNVADWAMELHDSKGNVLATADGASPETPEGVTMLLKKGTYSVYYCSFAGEPTITADWSVK